MAAMATPPLGPGNSKCLSCMPYRNAVPAIAFLTMFVCACDIIYGAFAWIVPNYDCNYGYCYSGRYFVWFTWTFIGQGVFGILMSILLLIGISKRIHKFLLTYIIGMILNSMGYFGNGAVMLALWNWYGTYVCYGVWAMFWSVIILYFVTVVAAYRTWMMQQRAGGGIPVYSQHLQPVSAQGMIIHPGTVFHQPMVSTVSGQIGYVQNVQPGTDLPPAYQPSTGTNHPQGTYLPHETQLSLGVQTHPAGQMSPGASSLPQTGDSSK